MKPYFETDRRRSINVRGLLGGLRNPFSSARPIPVSLGLGGETTIAFSSQNPIRGDEPLLVNRTELVEKWRRSPARIVSYEGGIHPDGTPYSGGTRLLVGEKGQEQQVMDSFETPWCEATAKALIDGKTGPQIIIEGGFGMGIMAEYLFQEMLSRGGEYHIIELNETIYKRLEKWAAEKQKWIDKMHLRSPLRIVPHFGDAYEVLQSTLPDGSRLFKPGTINGIVLDLHQLEEADRGIENLKGGEIVEELLEFTDGRLAICAFHKYNQTGDLDMRQRSRMSRLRYFVTPIPVNPSEGCDYFQWPNNRLPAVIAWRAA